MTQGLSFGDFVGHTTSSGGGSYLKKWQDRPEHAINVWFHTRAQMWVVWSHGFQRLVNYERDGRRGWEVWSDSLNCWEREDVNKSQYKRDSNGLRRSPPLVCGFCKMLEWIRLQIFSDQISWVEPIFEFEGDDPSKKVILHAGGITNLFGSKDLGDADKQVLYQEHISPRDAWKWNGNSKAGYLFSIVEHDQPGNGCVKTSQGTSLGDKVKIVLRDTALARPDLANYAKTPYPIRWMFDPKEGIAFDKKYHALRLEFGITDLIKELIFDTDPPDVKDDVARFNPAEVRAHLEKHSLIDMPWDQFFANMPMDGSGAAPEQESEQKASASASKSLFAGRGKGGAAAPSQPREPVRGQEAAPAAKGAPGKKSPDDADAVQCDACPEIISIDDKKCAHCGHVYEAEPDAPPPPPERKIRTRSEAAAAKKSVAASPAPPAAAPAPRQPGPPQSMRKGVAFQDVPPDDDDIPF